MQVQCNPIHQTAFIFTGYLSVDLDIIFTGIRHDASLVLPIRQTASIFKQPVTVVRNRPESRMRPEVKHGSQEQPRQVNTEVKHGSLEQPRQVNTEVKHGSQELSREVNTEVKHGSHEQPRQVNTEVKHGSQEQPRQVNTDKIIFFIFCIILQQGEKRIRRKKIQKKKIERIFIFFI